MFARIALIIKSVLRVYQEWSIDGVTKGPKYCVALHPSSLLPLCRMPRWRRTFAPCLLVPYRKISCFFHRNFS